MSKEIEKERVLLAEDDQSLAQLLGEELTEAGYDLKIASSAEEAGLLLKEWEPDMVISDLRLPGADGMTLLRWARECYAQPGFLIITAFGSIPEAVKALKSGADDFLSKPLDLEHFRLCVERILKHRKLQKEVLRFRDLMSCDNFQGMIGRSRKMRIMFDQLREISQAQGPVLIQGESGVGKELVAKALHDLSPRRMAPFLAINCAGIPAELLESEFFGHKEGAFTGAVKARPGLFQRTSQGVLFLDEIGEMPAGLQAKLLRVLQDGTFRPVGSNNEQQVDVRIICATNQDLAGLIDSGTFRRDLFYRLETFTITVPPLRERKEDIPLLTAHFLNRFCLEMKKDIRELTPEAMKQLSIYSFPGNIRELQSIIERAVTFCHGSRVDVEHLPTRVQQHDRVFREDPSASPEKTVDVLTRDHKVLPTLKTIAQDYIAHVLEKTGGNKRRAAAILGISRRTLYRHLDD